MMDYIQVVDEFKNRHVRTGLDLSLSLLPILINDLVVAGIDISITDGSFYQALSKELCGQESAELQSYVTDLLIFCGRVVPVKQKTEVKPPLPAPTVVRPVIALKGKEASVDVNGIIRTEHLTDNIPREEDEGDPFYIAPDQIINLSPEDFAVMEYDDEFCDLIGYKRPGR